ncbi:alpha-ketoglutarate-dependent taurine dioxygenase [Stipitochalara longipes BDJ]|nr:alpha-ketoglutarate-dependent taurine dioxygenase [Stipitochalara longipes BDJ]
MADQTTPVLPSGLQQARPIPGPKSFNRELELNGDDIYPPAKYPHYLPVWPEKTFAPLEPFEHVERGKGADSSLKELLCKGVSITEMTPSIGSEVGGLQLSRMSNIQKDQLALLVAQRKLVVFRDQGFADLPILEAIDFAAYFGRPYVHLTSGCPEGHEAIHLVHRGAGDKGASSFMSNRINTVGWHCDSSFEEQPPGTTMLYVLEHPITGGDTLFVDQVQAYKNLSPEFQRRLHGLKAVHSGKEQAQFSRNREGIVRRDPATTEHPIVRTHPATGEKALFVNKSFTRSIVGYKKEESDNLLNFLYDHIAFGADFQARVQWRPGMVIFWDNRLVAHTATMNWTTGERRHLARIALQAERPYETPFE